MINRRWALSVLCASTLAMAETYRWVDEQGNVHFGDKQPPNQHAEDISTQLEQSNIDQGSSTAAQQLQQRKNDRSARQVEEQQKAQLRSPYEQQRAKDCQEARRELSILQGRVIFYDEQGNEVKVTEKERVQRAAAFEALLKKNCD